jgi:hypothetical protein
VAHVLHLSSTLRLAEVFLESRTLSSQEPFVRFTAPLDWIVELTSAVGVLDYSMQLATVGFSAAYVHEREPGITYNVFEAPKGPAGTQGNWTTNPGQLSIFDHISCSHLNI